MKEEGKRPSLSVLFILKEYNKQEFIQSLNSVIKQDSPIIEAKGYSYLEQIIILNLTGKDDCLSCIQEYYEEEERIILLKADVEMSVPQAINSAIELVTGTYLSFLHSGSLWLMGKVKVQIEAMESLPQTKWIYGQAKNRNLDKKIPDSSLESFKKAGYLFFDLLREMTLSVDTLTLRAEAFWEVGGLDEGLPAYYMEEWVLRMAKAFPLAYQEQIVAQIKEQKEEINSILAVRLLLMAEYRSLIESSGLKEELLSKLYRQAAESRQEDFFWEYAKELKEDSLYTKVLEELWKKSHPSRSLLLSKEPTVAGVINCVGCCGCEVACPVDAITMKRKQDGFLYPVVDEKICILCGKCLRVCPTQQQLSPVPIPKDCFAMQAGEQSQQESSSGGIFPLLAKETLERGGYVAGAVYGREFHVHHILSNDPKEVRRMCSSKYVQSDTRGIFKEIHLKLQEGKEVLFTGTACQIAGLRGYLGKSYGHLFTVDVVCHGVPSPMVYEAYLAEHKARSGEIEEINFRKKQVLGWKSGVYLHFKDGKQYIAKGYDPYMAVFLNDWGLRKCCYSCEFKEARYSDLTLGDFWGIERLDPQLEKGFGTSVVLANTKKGEDLVRRIEQYLEKKKVFPSSEAIKYNPSIQNPVKDKKYREIFFAHFRENQKQKQKKTLQHIIIQSLNSIRFDIGLVLWWSPNYGNALTNYALYKTLEKEYKVMAIDNVTMSPMERFARFARDNYELSSDYFPRGAVDLIGNACRTYVVGSDQTWNYFFNKQFGLGKYFQMDFIPDHKHKISYAASFGTRGAESPGEEYKKAYRRLDAISVREQFGVESCKSLYEVEASWVLDPVFLLEPQDYDRLAEKSSVKEEESYLLCYLLNPSPEKVKVCRRMQKLLGGIKLIHISENSDRDRERNRHLFNFENVMGNIEVEDWIYYFKNAEFVITDSFHGTCFSVIFEKRFISFVNRQRDRFLVFEHFSFLSQRIITEKESDAVDQYIEEINYKKVKEEMDEERIKSLQWLKEHVNIK